MPVEAVRHAVLHGNGFKQAIAIAKAAVTHVYHGFFRLHQRMIQDDIHHSI